MTPAAALLRFQTVAAARIGLRLSIPLFAAGVVTLGLQDDPARTMQRAAAALAGPAPSVVPWIVVAAILIAVASWSAAPLATVERGWIVHLPATRRDRAVARWGGAMLVQTPIVAIVTALVTMEAKASGVRALAWLPVAPSLACAVALMTGSRLRRRSPGRSFRPTQLGFAPLVFARTVRGRLLEAWITGALPLAMAALFLGNNALDDASRLLGATLGGGVATTTVLSILGLALIAKRPSWSWARSLPVGSTRRVREDAVLLGVAALPAILTTAALVPLAGLVVATALPWLGLRAAAAIRTAGRADTSMAWFFAEGAAVSGLLALVPWLAAGTLVVLPAALSVARTRDEGLRRRRPA